MPHSAHICYRLPSYSFSNLWVRLHHNRLLLFFLALETTDTSVCETIFFRTNNVVGALWSEVWLFSVVFMFFYLFIFGWSGAVFMIMRALRPTAPHSMRHIIAGCTQCTTYHSHTWNWKHTITLLSLWNGRHLSLTECWPVLWAKEGGSVRGGEKGVQLLEGGKVLRRLWEGGTEKGLNRKE